MILSKKNAHTHLFVDDVEGENTEAVELLLACGRTHTVERAAKKNSVNTYVMMLLRSTSCIVVPCDCWENGAHGVGKIPTH